MDLLEDFTTPYTDGLLGSSIGEPPQINGGTLKHN